MKQRILIFLIVHVICINLNAQIQRNILGLTLGKSSPTETVNILRNRNLNVEKMGMGTSTLYVKEVFFAGKIWTFVILEFFHDKLCKIEFVEPRKFSSQEKLNKLWETIYDTIKTKYREYIVKDNKDYYINCSDRITIIEAGFQNKAKDTQLILHYMDIEYMTKKVNSYNDDL